MHPGPKSFNRRKRRVTKSTGASPSLRRRSAAEPRTGCGRWRSTSRGNLAERFFLFLRSLAHWKYPLHNRQQDRVKSCSYSHAQASRTTGNGWSSGANSPGAFTALMLNWGQADSFPLVKNPNTSTSQSAADDSSFFSGFIATGGVNENGNLSRRLNPSEAERRLQSIPDDLLLYHFTHSQSGCWHLLLNKPARITRWKDSLIFFMQHEGRQMGLNKQHPIGKVRATPTVTYKKEISLAFEPAKQGMPNLC